jgi:hypothetical protein
MNNESTYLSGCSSVTRSSNTDQLQILLVEVFLFVGAPFLTTLAAPTTFAIFDLFILVDNETFTNL